MGKSRRFQAGGREWHQFTSKMRQCRLTEIRPEAGRVLSSLGVPLDFLHAAHHCSSSSSEARDGSCRRRCSCRPAESGASSSNVNATAYTGDKKPSQKPTQSTSSSPPPSAAGNVPASGVTSSNSSPTVDQDTGGNERRSQRRARACRVTCTRNSTAIPLPAPHSPGNVGARSRTRCSWSRNSRPIPLPAPTPAGSLKIVGESDAGMKMSAEDFERTSSADSLSESSARGDSTQHPRTVHSAAIPMPAPSSCGHESSWTNSAGSCSNVSTSERFSRHENSRTTEFSSASDTAGVAAFTSVSHSTGVRVSSSVYVNGRQMPMSSASTAFSSHSQSSPACSATFDETYTTAGRPISQSQSSNATHSHATPMTVPDGSGVFPRGNISTSGAIPMPAAHCSTSLHFTHRPSFSPRHPAQTQPAAGFRNNSWSQAGSSSVFVSGPSLSVSSCSTSINQKVSFSFSTTHSSSFSSSSSSSTDAGGISVSCPSSCVNTFIMCSSPPPCHTTVSYSASSPSSSCRCACRSRRSVSSSCPAASDRSRSCNVDVQQGTAVSVGNAADSVTTGITPTVGNCTIVGAHLPATISLPPATTSLPPVTTPLPPALTRDSPVVELLDGWDLRRRLLIVSGTQLLVSLALHALISPPPPQQWSAVGRVEDARATQMMTASRENDETFHDSDDNVDDGGFDMVPPAGVGQQEWGNVGDTDGWEYVWQ